MLLPDLSGSNELTWGKGRGQSYLWEWEGQKQASSLTHVTTCKQSAFHRDRSKIEKEARNVFRIHQCIVINFLECCPTPTVMVLESAWSWMSAVAAHTVSKLSASCVAMQNTLSTNTNNKPLYQYTYHCFTNIMFLVRYFKNTPHFFIIIFFLTKRD